VIKLILVGLWICAVTVASCYGAVMYFTAAKSETDNGAFGGIDYIKTEMTSVPVIRNGEVQGYVVVQLVFAVDSEKLKERHLEPAPFLVDEAYRAIYADNRINFKRIEKQELSELAKQIMESSNKRLKDNLIKEVLFQQLNYVAKDEIRANWTANKK
jgi:flagellar basal body-associated protein FliL